MDRNEAKTIINNTLIGYVDDCAGRNSAEAKLIEEAWNKINEPLNPEEVEDLKAIRDYLEPTSELFKTLSKVMEAIGCPK